MLDGIDSMDGGECVEMEGRYGKEPAREKTRVLLREIATERTREPFEEGQHPGKAPRT